jgi:hypothetical protein
MPEVAMYAGTTVPPRIQMPRASWLRSLTRTGSSSLRK